MRTRHPFTLLTLAAALPTLAWLLPAPAGALGTAAVAFGLAAAAGVRRVLVPAVVTAAPFWLFLFVLHAVLAPDRLVEAMVARGWSVTVAYVFAATLSAVPLFRARARRIVEAQRCRGLSPRGSVAKRLRALRALALPLLLSALHEVDERALALETRGLRSGARRTPLAPPPDPALERAARWALLLVCIAALVGRLV